MLASIFIESNDCKHCFRIHLALRNGAQKLCERALLDLEAVYMEFHYARHEKISLRYPLEALIAFTCANRNEISLRVLFHVGQFDHYEISCRG